MKQTDRVTASIEVGFDPEAAFDIFTQEIDAWWKRGPHDFYDSKRAVAMRFESGVGGRYLEIYDDTKGDALEIGRITVWEPGRRLAWRMSLDDTEVDVRFEAIPGGTRIALEQRLVFGGKTAKFYTGWDNILGWFGDWSRRKKDIPSASKDNGSAGYCPKITAADVVKVLGLGKDHAAWLAKLDPVHPAASLIAPDKGELPVLLANLGVAAEDTDDVIQSMPCATRTPAAWWILERSHQVFTSRLANRDTAPAKSNLQSASAPAWPMWSQSSLSPLPPALRLFPVHLIVVAAGSIRQCHREFGVPDNISWKTLSYLGRAMAVYRRNHGETGVELTRWDWLRFLGWLYEVGRLEVTHYRIRKHPEEAGPLFWYEDETIAHLGPGFRIGDPALSIHVQPGEPLTPEALTESFHRMRADVTGMYPGDPLRVATCTSWLLDEQLAEYLPADSNILAFQSRFHLVPGARDDDAIVRFVFGCERPNDLEALPQTTALERAVVEHLRRGRRWRLRTGWLDLRR